MNKKALPGDASAAIKSLKNHAPRLNESAGKLNTQNGMNATKSEALKGTNKMPLWLQEALFKLFLLALAALAFVACIHALDKEMERRTDACRQVDWESHSCQSLWDALDDADPLKF